MAPVRPARFPPHRRSVFFAGYVVHGESPRTTRPLPLADREWLYTLLCQIDPRPHPADPQMTAAIQAARLRQACPQTRHEHAPVPAPRRPPMTGTSQPSRPGPALTCPSWLYTDARHLEYLRLLGWGWTPVDAAFAAYYGKPPALVLNPAHDRHPHHTARPDTRPGSSPGTRSS